MNWDDNLTHSKTTRPLEFDSLLKHVSKKMSGHPGDEEEKSGLSEVLKLLEHVEVAVVEEVAKGMFVSNQHNRKHKLRHFLNNSGVYTLHSSIFTHK